MGEKKQKLNNSESLFLNTSAGRLSTQLRKAGTYSFFGIIQYAAHNFQNVYAI